jgi:hypothetical protein
MIEVIMGVDKVAETACPSCNTVVPAATPDAFDAQR